MHMFRTASLKLGLDYAVMYNLKKSVRVSCPLITCIRVPRPLSLIA